MVAEPELLKAVRGAPIEIVEQVHRRFWTDAEGRHSRVEVVATSTELGELNEPD